MSRARPRTTPNRRASASATPSLPDLLVFHDDSLELRDLCCSSEADLLDLYRMIRASKVHAEPMPDPDPKTRQRFLAELTNSRDGTPVLDPAPFARYHELDVDPEPAPDGVPGHYVIIVTPSEAIQLDLSVTNDEHETACDIIPPPETRRRRPEWSTEPSKE